MNSRGLASIGGFLLHGDGPEMGIYLLDVSPSNIAFLDLAVSIQCGNSTQRRKDAKTQRKDSAIRHTDCCAQIASAIGDAQVLSAKLFKPVQTLASWRLCAFALKSSAWFRLRAKNFPVINIRCR